MASFDYTAMDGNGREQKGRIDAESQQAAISLLKERKLIPMNISPAADAKKSAPKQVGGGGAKIGGGPKLTGNPVLPRKQLSTFTRQLATLLDAGLPLVRALRTLERQAKRMPAVQAVIGDIATQVEGGQTFSEALAAHPKSFEDLYVNMIRAGEASGAMEAVLNRLAEFMEKADRLARKVKAALMYPTAVLIIALIITAGLMTFIVPKFKKIFEELLAGEPLPGLTEFVISISRFMTDYWWICIGGALIFFVAFKIFKNTPQGSFMIDQILLKMPPFGGLVTKVNTARFCRTFSTLLASGVAILKALEIVRDTTGNQVVAKAIVNIHDAVKEGESITRPMEQANVFPLMMISMVEVGEETGALPEMLVRVADIYEEEVDTAVDGLTSLIEPCMIVFLAVVVGGIVIAMFLPMIKLMEKMG